MLFTEKYRPRKLDEVISNNPALIKLKSFVLRNPKKKALLVYGPSGTGKTCSIYALANELELDVIEVNASDQRNKDHISSIVRNAAMQSSIFNKGKIILIDEVDGISGNQDRGGVQELVKAIDESHAPIVLVVNDPWNEKLNPLRSKCELVEFYKIDYNSILILLKKICEKEGILASEANLVNLARKVDGDLRAAINDLQSLMETGIIQEEFSIRDKKESIFEVLKTILEDKDLNKVFRSMDSKDVDTDELFLWLDENLASCYTSRLDLYRAYEALSRADIYRGRIRRQQYYRFLVYIDVLLHAGISFSKYNNINKNVKFKRTTRLLKIWRANAKNAKKKEIARKFAAVTHMSVKSAVKDFSYYKNILSDKNVANELKFSKEDLTGI